MEDRGRYLPRGLPHWLPAWRFARTILHGNVTDFEPFGRNHRLTFPRKKLERLKDEPEDNWDLMWNTTIIYSLFPNTLLLVQGDHVELARVFPNEGRVDRSVMELSLYVPQAPSTDEERVHWDKNMQLVLDVVTGRGLTSRTHDPDRSYVGRADAHGVRPQRAGHDPLSPVDACRSRARLHRRYGQADGLAEFPRFPAVRATGGDKLSRLSRRARPRIFHSRNTEAEARPEALALCIRRNQRSTRRTTAFRGSAARRMLVSEERKEDAIRCDQV